MPQYTVLVIEDDSAIRRGIVDALEYDNHKTREAATGQEGMDQCLGEDIDLILLDLTLPVIDGFQILDYIRKHNPTLAVIILTARGAESERLRGLNGGADDYVVKPFSIKELLARVQAVLRRSAERPLPISEIPFHRGKIDLQRAEVLFSNGETTELSEKEVELLDHLASNPGRSISREELLTRVWKVKSNGLETRTIDMHIARLREKLKEPAGHPSVLLTVRGKGYKFNGEVSH